MPKLRVKVEMNKGGVGVKLVKLTQIANEALKFFQMLSKDAGIECKLDDWIARRNRRRARSASSPQHDVAHNRHVLEPRLTSSRSAR